MVFPKRKRHVNRELLDRIKKLHCAACNTSQDIDPAHIKTRGSGGDDYFYNVIPLCRAHHTEQGARGWMHMVESYPWVKLALLARHWTWGDKSPSRKLFHENFDPSRQVDLELGWDIDVDYAKRPLDEE